MSHRSRDASPDAAHPRQAPGECAPELTGNELTGNKATGSEMTGSEMTGNELTGNRSMLAGTARSRRGVWRIGAGGVVLFFFLAGGLVLADWWSALPDDAQAHYVGRQTCAECHQAEMNAWTGSHHDLAMDRATEETVLADFNDVQVEHHGVVSRMFRRDGKFLVHTEGPDGEMADFGSKRFWTLVEWHSAHMVFQRCAMPVQCRSSSGLSFSSTSGGGK